MAGRVVKLLFWADRTIFAKMVVACAAAFGIGVGLCGLDFVLGSNGIGKSTQEFGVGPLDSVSLFLMIISPLGLVVTTIIWIATKIFQSMLPAREEDSPQKLFVDSNDESAASNRNEEKHD